MSKERKLTIRSGLHVFSAFACSGLQGQHMDHSDRNSIAKPIMRECKSCGAKNITEQIRIMVWLGSMFAEAFNHLDQEKRSRYIRAIDSLIDDAVADAPECLITFFRAFVAALKAQSDRHTMAASGGGANGQS